MEALHDDDSSFNDHPYPAKFLDFAEAVIEHRHAEHDREAGDDLVPIHVRRRPSSELAGACAALAGVILDYRAALLGADIVVLPAPDDGVYARIHCADGSAIELRLPPGDGQ